MLGRRIEVSEAAILAACEELCQEHGGDRDRVAAYAVRAKVGGGSKRVGDLVKQWRDSTVIAEQAPSAASVETGDLPADVAHALQRMHSGLDALSRCMKGAMGTMLHDERRRAAEAAHAAELAAASRLEQERIRTARAQEDADGFSSDLDEAAARAEEAEAEVERLRSELTAAQEAARIVAADRDRLAAECDRLRADAEKAEGERAKESQRRGEAEKKRDVLQQELISLGREHDERILHQQEQHRQDVAAERARTERLADKAEARFEAEVKRLEELQDERQQLRDRVQQLEAEATRGPQAAALAIEEA